MKEFLWKSIAYIVSRRPVADYLARRAMEKGASCLGVIAPGAEA